MIFSIKNYYKSLIDNKLYKNILVLFSGVFFARLVPFLLSPLLSRLYTPADFGGFSLVLITSALFSIAITGSYEYAILLPKNNIKAFHILIAAIFISLFSALLFYSLFFLLKLLNISYLHGNSFYWFSLSVLVFSLLQAFFRLLSYWQNRNEKYTKIATATASKGLITSPVQAFLKYFQISQGLFWGELLGQFLQLALLAKSSFSDLSRYLRFFSIKNARKLLIRYIKFPIFTLPSDLLNFVSAQLPIFMLAIFFTETTVGWYFFAHKLLSAPLNMLGNATSQVYLREIAAHKTNKAKIAEISFDIFRKIFTIGILPFSLLSIYGDIIFEFIFGNQWLIAGEYARFLSPWLFFALIFSPISAIFQVLEKQQIALISNLILLILRFASLFVGAYFLQNATISILLFGASGFLFWVIFGIYTLKTAHVKLFPVLKLMLGGVFFVSLPILLIRLLLAL